MGSEMCIRDSNCIDRRQHFSDKEWFRIKKDTLDGKCSSCMPVTRCANGFRTCRMCAKAKALSEYTMWTLAHGAHTKKKQSCNECMQLGDIEKEACRTRNKANVQVSHDGNSAPQVDMNPHVTIFCPECDASQSIEMNSLWKRGNQRNRFLRWSCTNEWCSKKNVSLGNWLRFQNDSDSKIVTWLKTKGIYEERTRPATINVTEYMERQEGSDRGKQRKRKRESDQSGMERQPKHKIQK